MGRSERSFFLKFINYESASGIMLFGAAVLAILVANSPINTYYELLITTPVAIKVGALGITKPLFLWVNDGLMAIFFFLIGLELKREFLEGELSDKKNIILPGLGAIGGMVCPSLIYVALNYQDDVAMKGWAIPVATDIAFALGVLSLLGPRVPKRLKIFLTSLAIFDDIGAIIIIALFYTNNISSLALVVVALCMGGLFLLNRFGVADKSPYLVIGLIMWIALVKSGVHATLGGVILAMFIPLKSSKESDPSPLTTLENDLHAMVAFFILPIFAFFNSGFSLAGMGLEQLLHDIPLGISLGLFVGKQIGVFVSCWLGIKLRITDLPTGMTWMSLYGTAALSGIGFTMSLFIGSLAFEANNVNLIIDERLGILLGSMLSGTLGFFLLKSSLRAKQ